MVTHALIASLLAYWAEDHKKFNVQMLRDSQPFEFTRGTRDVRTIDDYLKRVLYVSKGTQATVKGVPFTADPKGSDLPTDLPSGERTLRSWHEFGGLWEDGFQNMSEARLWGGLRAPNHFHDPLAFGGGGYTGIKTETGFTARWRKEKSGLPGLDLLRPGVSVTQWVQGGKASEKNEWSYGTVSAGFTEFFTKLVQEQRERGLANAFRSLGQVVHLITDNTVPDHARDLAHPGNGFEEWLHDQAGAFDATPRPWTRFPLERVERSGIRAFWDQDVYSGSNPEASLDEGAGITEFTQAHFLAWNRFTPPGIIHWPNVFLNPGGALVENDILYFTTVPATTGVGFDPLKMPWPRLTGPVGDDFGAEPPGLSLPKCVARKKGSRNIIDENCWAGYAMPLMKRAHGTSEAVYKLAMPPLRAELIPEPGELTRFRVRLWNLGGAAGDAVTLRLDEVSFTSVRFEGEAMGTVRVESPGGTPLPPDGAPWTSGPFAFTLREQGILKLSSYGAVVLKAHLGTNPETPVSFAVPIPNGFPVVNQLTSTVRINAQTRALNNQSNCCSTTCTACGENAEFVQPILQDVTGFIGRYSSQLDTLGRPADGLTRTALDEDTRIAGVALVAWARVGGRYDAPLRPMASRLTVTHPQLEPRGDMFVRKADAMDQKDPDRVPFSIALDVRDFYGASAGSYTATQTVHLLVWMTSGAVYTQTLALWPVRRPETVDVALASEECNDLTGRNMQYEMAGGCTSTRNGEPMCSPGTYETSLRTHLFGPLRGIGTPDVEYFAVYPHLKLLQLGGVQVSSASPTCVPNVMPGRSYSIRCFSDFNSFIMENTVTQGTGACPSIPPRPTMPRTATMRPEWPPELKMGLQKLFGRTDEPAFEDVELR